MTDESDRERLAFAKGYEQGYARIPKGDVAILDAIATGKAHERARIVEWLRRMADNYRQLRSGSFHSLQHAADAIESGDHWDE